MFFTVPYCVPQTILVVVGSYIINIFLHLKSAFGEYLFYFIFLFIYLRYLNRRVQFSMAGLNGGLLKTVLYK